MNLSYNYFACVGVNPHKSSTFFYVCSKNSFENKEEAKLWLEDIPFIRSDIIGKLKMYKKWKYTPISLSANYHLWAVPNKIQYY